MQNARVNLLQQPFRQAVATSGPGSCVERWSANENAAEGISRSLGKPDQLHERVDLIVVPCLRDKDEFVQEGSGEPIAKFARLGTRRCASR